jgi:predicted metal-dependent hydrolase
MPASSNSILSTATSELRLGGAPLALRIDRRARALRLRVDRRSGGLMLTVPAGTSRRRALAWAAEQEAWARRALAALPEPLRLAPGAALALFGRPHRIDWSPERPRRIALENGAIVCGGPTEGLEARLLRWAKAEALALLTAETRELAATLPVRLGRVGIGDPRSRWGSCTGRGDIRYSWRLILAPDFVRRATVAHEVAHLVHMNHGPDFHALAAHLFGGDPAPARDWLRRHGAELHRIAG